MDIKTIKKILMEKLNIDKIIIRKDGNLFKIIVVSEIFKNISNLERQKLIYSPLANLITENKIHAVSIKAYTPIEWIKIGKIH